MPRLDPSSFLILLDVLQSSINLAHAGPLREVPARVRFLKASCFKSIPSASEKASQAHNSLILQALQLLVNPPELSGLSATKAFNKWRSAHLHSGQSVKDGARVQYPSARTTGSQIGRPAIHADWIETRFHSDLQNVYRHSRKATLHQICPKIISSGSFHQEPNEKQKNDHAAICIGNSLRVRNPADALRDFLWASLQGGHPGMLNRILGTVQSAWTLTSSQSFQRKSSWRIGVLWRACTTLHDRAKNHGPYRHGIRPRSRHRTSKSFAIAECSNNTMRHASE